MQKKDINYDKLYFEQSFLYSHNSIFYFKNVDRREKKIFPLKLLLPDYLYENFNLLDDQQKKNILNFIKIFLARILSYSYDTDNYAYYRKFFYTVYLGSQRDINNRINFKFFFPFKNQVKIHKFYGKWVDNCKNNFILGKTNFYSYLEKNKPIGKRVFLPTKSTAIGITIEPNEHELFLTTIKRLGTHFIFLASKIKQTRTAQYLLIISDGKCKLITNTYSEHI
ncbi:MAG: hypothetical protein K2X39_00190 [Silvanigrellaceae bacterium]|nr:hypothetical protein [Silvanigrellaceae bacterium]